MKENLFRSIPVELTDELSTVIAGNRSVKIERIVSDGHRSPDDFWYDQEQNEWVLLVSGSAVLSIEKPDDSELVEMSPGDHLLIPSRQRHRVESTSSTEKTVWLAVFF